MRALASGKYTEWFTLKEKAQKKYALQNNFLLTAL